MGLSYATFRDPDGDGWLFSGDHQESPDLRTYSSPTDSWEESNHAF
jgi:hypothetical protein